MTTDSQTATPEKAAPVKQPQVVCTVVLSKGKRKGLSCNRKILQEGETFCKFHQNRITDKTSCNIILTKGDRKNQPCNRKVIEGGNLCKIHQSLEDKRPFNPYVTKESDIKKVKKTITSTIGQLDVNKLHPALQNL